MICLFIYYFQSNMASPIDVLESRISELEIQVYGKNGMKTMIDTPSPDSSILDNLLHVNTLVSSSLSGRKNTNALVTRLLELNDLLDMSNKDDDVQTESKAEILLTMESDFYKNLEHLNKIQELSSSLDADELKYIPELTPKIETMALNYLQNYEKSTKISNDIQDMFSKYNSIINTISKSMVTLDAAICAAEMKKIALKTK